MHRAKGNIDNTIGSFVVVSFDDFDPPIYPMTGDKVTFVDESSGKEFLTKIQITHWGKRLVYLRIDTNQ